jgi:hypothetical protein
MGCLPNHWLYMSIAVRKHQKLRKFFRVYQEVVYTRTLTSAQIRVSNMGQNMGRRVRRTKTPVNEIMELGDGQGGAAVREDGADTP